MSELDDHDLCPRCATLTNHCNEADRQRNEAEHRAAGLEMENHRLTKELAALTAEYTELLENMTDLGNRYSELGVAVEYMATGVPSTHSAPHPAEVDGCSCFHEPHQHAIVETTRYPASGRNSEENTASGGVGSATPQGQAVEANLTGNTTDHHHSETKRRVGRPAAPPRPLPPLPAPDAVIHPANNDLLRSLQRAHAIAEYRRQGLTTAAACERAGMKCTYATRVSQGLEAVAAAAIPMDFTRMLPGSGAITMLISHSHLLPKLFATPRATQREVAAWCGAYPSPEHLQEQPE